MSLTRNFARKYEEEEDDYFQIDSSYEDFNSDDSEDDPTYDDDLDEAHSKLSRLSIAKKTNSSGHHMDSEADDGEVSDVEEISAPVLNKVDLKVLEQVQKLIDAGQVDKLKVEQCKVYLRKHGLRLMGKKDVLIQRIKEHTEILNGGGEKKYPPSSFVLNCKGDACMGDIVMFEQTVYQGYNLASRSAIGPPCGKRMVAGRIVKESYGAAKQQHTFTVEVLWSKGQKPLPPLHPLLIKGRNLYKLNTMRQRWEDEAKRQRVLDEKHRRGFIARSNREARIQEKEARKMIKSNRVFPKECKNSRQQKNVKHESKHIAQQRQTSQVANPMSCAEFKGNSNQGRPKFQPNLPNKKSIPIYEAQYPYPSQTGPPTFQLSKSAESSFGSDHMHGYLNNSFTGNAQNSYPSQFLPPTCQLSKPTESSFGSDCGYLNNYFTGNPMPSDNFQQTKDSRHQLCRDYKVNSFPKPYYSGCRNTGTNAQGNVTFSHRPLHQLDSNRAISYRRNQRPSNTQQKLCPYYSQGRCNYGNECKFLHEFNRNYC